MAGSCERKAPLRDGVALALLMFLLCRLVAQQTFYGPDGRIILKMTMSGMVAHPHHFLYVPMLRASHAVVTAWGGSWYEAGMLLSQVGAALGVFFWHRACARLGMPRGAAAMVVALCASAPAVLFFASVIELHAPFLAFAGLSTYLAACWAQRPSPLRALTLGVSTGLAVGAHATAHLLLLWLLPLVLGEAEQRGRWWRLLVVVGIAHVGVTLLLVPVFVAVGADVHAGAAATQLIEFGKQRLRPDWLPPVLWQDGLRPFAPLSFVTCLALLRGWRLTLAHAIGVGFVTSLAATFLLMAPSTENGAYLLPLVWPAAILVVRKLPRAVCWLTVLAGLALGWRWIVAHDAPEYGRAFAADLRAIAAGRPVDMICGQHREFDVCFIFAPDVDWRELINEANQPPQAVPMLAAGLRAWVASRERAGRSVLFTEGAMQYLQAPVGSEPRTGPLLWQAIQEEMRLEPVRGVVLRGWWLHAL